MNFEQFWELYDKKVGKKPCESRWKRLTKKQIEKIAIHLPLYVESTPVKQYRLNPKSYLNQHAWNNEIIVRVSGVQKDALKTNKTFIDHYDREYARKLPTHQLPLYWAHLRSLGWRPVQTHGSGTIWVEGQ